MQGISEGEAPKTNWQLNWGGRRGERKEISKGEIPSEVLLQEGGTAGLVLSQGHTTQSKAAGLTY